MQVGYFRKNDGVVDCKGGYSGRKSVWSKLVFDEKLTRNMVTGMKEMLK